MANEYSASGASARPKRGGRPSPRSALAAAMPFSTTIGAPPNFICIPKQLSTWGNLDHGDCVTAEEAFAKACNNPEIFIADNEVIRWATQHNVLEGAYLNEVLAWMQSSGFHQDGNSYNDGLHHTVDWTNSSTLRSAIAQGPVKIGVAANQLETAWQSSGGQSGWFATGFQADTAEDHCVSLCGYGTISWLAEQLNVAVPEGIDGSGSGYALFTWGSIGVIDAASMIAITHEAWLRRPTTVVKPLAATGFSATTTRELHTLLNQHLASAPNLSGAVGGGAQDFCSVWPTAKPVLQFLSGVVGLIPGAGTGAGIALNALVVAAQAVYDQTCGSHSTQ